MFIMDIFSIGNFDSHHIFSLSENLLRPLSDREKRIAAVVFTVLSAFVVGYLIYRCCFFEEDIVITRIDDDHKLNPFFEDDQEEPILDDKLQQALDCYKANKFSDAALHFEEALENDPKNIRIINHYADSLFHQDLFHQAAAQYEEALKIGPKNFTALKGYANTLFKLGRFYEAKIKYDEAINLETDEAIGSDFLFGYAENLLACKEKRRAKRVLIEALEDDRDKKSFECLKALFSEKRFVLALDLCRKYVKRNRHSSEHFVEKLIPIVRELRLNGNVDEAEQLMKIILKEHKSPYALKEYGDVLNLRGNFKKAYRTLEKALDNAPDDFLVSIMLSMGKALLLGEKIGQAEKEYRSILKKDSQNVEALAYLGFILSLQGKLIEARGKLETALKLEPQNITALGYYAHVLSKQDNLDEAIEVYRKILELDPLNSTAQDCIDKLEAKIAT